LKQNAGGYRDLRIQACPVCFQTGGGSDFFGDVDLDRLTLIPTASGTGWLIDANTNSMETGYIKTIGGTFGVNIRGSGSGLPPDGIFFEQSNLTAAVTANMQILKGRNIWITDGSSIGGCTGGPGVLVNGAAASDVDGVFINGSQVRGNFKQGVYFQKGANLEITDGSVNGNSNGGGSGTYSNVHIGAAAVGLVKMVGVTAGLSNTGELLANVTGPAKAGIEFDSGALTDATNFPGRCLLVGNVFDGCVTGDIVDNGMAPTGHRKVIANNMLLT
jgi:hypothetical protein